MVTNYQDTILTNDRMDWRVRGEGARTHIKLILNMSAEGVGMRFNKTTSGQRFDRPIEDNWTCAREYTRAAIINYNIKVTQRKQTPSQNVFDVPTVVKMAVQRRIKEYHSPVVVAEYSRWMLSGWLEEVTRNVSKRMKRRRRRLFTIPRTVFTSCNEPAVSSSLVRCWIKK